jgi:hypothetical protein
MLRTLADALEALRRLPGADRHRDLAERARALLQVDGQVVSSFSAYTQDPQRLLAEREKAGELLAEIVGVAGASGVERAAEMRRAGEAKARRAMLRERHLTACKRLGVEAVSDSAWAALWPR